MTALIDLFPPKPDEGPVGYMRRLAVANGYSNWKSLMRAAGVNPSANAIWHAQPSLIETLGVETEWLEAVTPEHLHGSGLHDPFFQRSAADPICPHCIGEDAHIRHAWSHCFVTACPEHGTMLIEQCPSCGSELDQLRHDIAYCDCGYELSNAPTEPASAVHRWISARIAGDMRPIDTTAELGAHNDYLQLARVLFLLGVRYDPRKKVLPSKVSRPRTIVESVEFLQPVCGLLNDWPHRFHAHLGERFAAGNQRDFSLSGRLGQYYLALSSLCNKPQAFSALWTAFSDAVIDHFDGNLRGQNLLRPSPGKNRRYVSISEAARELNCSHATLDRAVRTGKVKGHETRCGTTLSIWLVKTCEVARIGRERAKWVTEDKAADALGVPAGILIGLRRAGLLAYDSNWKHTIEKAGPIPAAALDELVEKVRSHLEERDEPQTLSFAQLSGRRTTDATATRKLYRAIVAGEVRPVGYEREHRLGGFLFAASDVKRYLGAVALNDGLTLTQVEKATGWKYESLSHWVNEGFLQSAVVDLQGRPARVVPLAALLAFRRDWLPVSDIASALNSKSSAISRKLASCNVVVHGHKLLPDGAKRGGLVRLSDVAQLLFASERLSPS